jgi:hypothetical protein
LTGLSRHESYVSLTGNRGGGLKMNKYCNQYCVPEAERKKGKVAIWRVTDLTLRTILFTIARMAGSVAPHMALQSYFQYAIECTEPRIFNWANAVLRKYQKATNQVQARRTETIWIWIFVNVLPRESPCIQTSS